MCRLGGCVGWVCRFRSKLQSGGRGWGCDGLAAMGRPNTTSSASNVLDLLIRWQYSSPLTRAGGGAEFDGAKPSAPPRPWTIDTLEGRPMALTGPAGACVPGGAAGGRHSEGRGAALAFRSHGVVDAAHPGCVLASGFGSGSGLASGSDLGLADPSARRLGRKSRHQAARPTFVCCLPLRLWFRSGHSGVRHRRVLLVHPPRAGQSTRAPVHSLCGVGLHVSVGLRRRPFHCCPCFAFHERRTVRGSSPTVSSVEPSVV